jgi:Leucine-rich repeat (LRR) protein
MKGNYKNLCSLEILDLRDNGINGDINELMERLPQCTRDKLRELHLGDNNFTGTLPNLTGNFTNLSILDLSANNLIGRIPPELGYLSRLTTLYLANNHLNGTIPTKIGAMTNLISLDLSNNNLNGTITEEHFAGLISLKKLNLASNNLKVVVGAHWYPPFKLQDARFATCLMGPLFPAWLQLQLEIIHLDLSSNALVGKIPDWFWQTFSLAAYIDISNNQFSGTLLPHFSHMDFLLLNISSNQLTGTIPQFPRNAMVVDMSINSFSGPLPSIEAPKLMTLLMFSNQIGGSIPESFCTLKKLQDLDLSSSGLEGEVPHCPEWESIEYLQLSNNSLSGYFPAFLRACPNLKFVDLGQNNFSGSLPAWIGEVTYLKLLRLSHNIFSGNIPTEITKLNNLQYLDLSSNNISGVIPWVLSNLTGMTSKGYQPSGNEGSQIGNDSATTVSQFEDVMLIITKGQQLRYGEGSAYFVGIDLSGNSLTGEIPSDVTSLDALISLNLSSNYLSGKIPNKIGSMLSLESLDLSKNKIFGEIPASLSNLTSLSYLNLSYNNLSGSIPTGRQLDTLNADNPSIMYIGNSGLCGPPLKKNCSGNDVYVHGNHRSNRQELDSMPFHLGLMLGFTVGLWVVFCALLFKKTWRISYFQIFDKLHDKVYVFVALRWASLTRSSVASI